MSTSRSDETRNPGRASIVIGHPDPASFTHGIAREVGRAWERAGFDVTTIDLYTDGFDPKLGAEELARGFSFDPLTQTYVDTLEASSFLAFVYPEWWGQPPAILKGYIDRVWIAGVAYEFLGEEFLRKHHRGLLGHIGAMVLTTTDAEPGRSTGRSFWTDEVLRYAGIGSAVFKTMYRVRDSSFLERRQWLEEISQTAAALITVSRNADPESDSSADSSGTTDQSDSA